jgi:hypothetical protein
MDNSFQTSFIPKKPMIPASSSIRRKSAVSLTMVFFVLLLIVTGVAAGGLFFYKNYLKNQETTLSASLSAESSNFDQKTIDELELFDKRNTVAKQILTSHIVLSPMFTLLGNLTIPAIQYTHFEQTKGDTGYAVKLSGIAKDYKSIALQADVFNSEKGRSFKGVVFSNLTKEASGNVTFDVGFTVDPSLLSYANDVSSSIPTDATASQTSSTQAPTDQVTLPPVTPSGSTSTNPSAAAGPTQQ